jgi:hypothetical protein
VQRGLAVVDAVRTGPQRRVQPDQPDHAVDREDVDRDPEPESVVPGAEPDVPAGDDLIEDAPGSR